MAGKQGSVSIQAQNIMPIIKKWMYSDKDIFVRELVSNGCDAITKLKLAAPQQAAEGELCIHVEVDACLLYTSGVMLINSLLILPAAASRNVARTAAGYIRMSVVFSVFAGVVGLILSYFLNTSAGAAVVLVAAAIYFITLPLRRR